MISSYFTKETQKEKIESSLDDQKKRIIESKIISKIAARIMTIGNEMSDQSHTKRKNENSSIKVKFGSLCSLYLSSYYTIDQLLYDLEEKKSIASICDFLINLLQSRFIQESILFIPQLLSMSIYHKSSSTITNFLLDMCVNQTKFSLTLYWLASSNLEDHKESLILNQFVTNIEETIVKNTRSNRRKYFSPTISKDLGKSEAQDSSRLFTIN